MNRVPTRYRQPLVGGSTVHRGPRREYRAQRTRAIRIGEYLHKHGAVSVDMGNVRSRRRGGFKLQTEAAWSHIISMCYPGVNVGVRGKRTLVFSSAVSDYLLVQLFPPAKRHERRRHPCPPISFAACFCVPWRLGTVPAAVGNHLAGDNQGGAVNSGIHVGSARHGGITRAV